MRQKLILAGALGVGSVGLFGAAALGVAHHPHDLSEEGGFAYALGGLSVQLAREGKVGPAHLGTEAAACQHGQRLTRRLLVQPGGEEAGAERVAGPGAVHERLDRQGEGPDRVGAPVGEQRPVGDSARNCEKPICTYRQSGRDSPPASIASARPESSSSAASLSA